MSIHYIIWTLLQLEMIPASAHTVHVFSYSQVTQHVTAIFLLLMFLLIDGSPETLGIGLFLGCESAARVIAAMALFGDGGIEIQNFLLQMSDVFKLYFGCQLARVAPKDLLPWVVLGSIVSIPYAIASGSKNEIWLLVSISVESMRVLATGLIGVWISLRVAMSIPKQKVPWRVLALSLASFGFLGGPVLALLDLLNVKGSSAQFSLIWHFASNLSFTLAAFVNISTFENRVRAVSSARARERIDRMKDEQKVHEAIAKTTQMLAHDVRKPFSLLRAHISSLSTADSIQDAQKIVARMIPDVQKSLNTVDQLISNVMDIGRDIAPEIKSIEPLQLIATCIELVFQVSKNPNISFKYHFRHHGKLLGDEHQLVRVFSNILENAEQAIAGRSEQITISSFNDFGSGVPRICIEISNTGSVIPPDDLKNIFDAFFTKGKTSGTGLGLAIVKKIIRSHGGVVSAVSSKALGTSFRFLIPALFDSSKENLRLPRFSSDVRLVMRMDGGTAIFAPSSKALQFTHHAQSAKVAEHSLNILIVDDEQAYLDASKSLIVSAVRSNANIFTSLSEDLNWRNLNSINMDIVICDYDLGSLVSNGIDILRSCRVHWPTIICVLHTNHILEGINTREPREISDFHFKKPLTLENIELILAEIQKRKKIQTKQVAIIEDDLIFAEHLERLLQGFKILIFSCPEEFTDFQYSDRESFDDLSAVVFHRFPIHGSRCCTIT
ncbi:MAG: hybrid sensor histidine kinase/response regulator [Proteobacteria bacterium]|nr:hybrid sensor histidine kinase/response regulator [Pseudomonadota bacterium]